MEDFLDALRNSLGQSLQLPVAVPFAGAFGLSALLVQAIGKWYELNEPPRTLSVAREFATSAETRERLAATIHGMTGIYFADDVVAGDEPISKNESMRAMAKYVFAMAKGAYSDTVRGVGTYLCCFQGALPENEFLSSLYAVRKRGKPASADSPELITVHNTAGFSQRIEQILRTQMNAPKERLGEERIRLLGSLIYQLFKNADVHTVRDAQGNEYGRSLRALSVRQITFQSLSQLNEFVSGDNQLRIFLTRTGIDPSISTRGGHTYLEISVVDTGPGLALKWTSQPQNGGVRSLNSLSLEEELAAVSNCFRLHATTYRQGHHGDGLVIALKALKDLRAFVSLRSGRLSLYQDFSRSDTDAFVPAHRFQDRPLLPPTSGTSYVICIPVPDK